MGPQEIDVRVHSQAPPEAIYAVPARVPTRGSASWHATANERVSYTTLSGLPIRDYRADVTLTPEGNGTVIHWRSTFYPKLPGTGGMLQRTLGSFIDAAARGLATHAANKATTP